MSTYFKHGISDDAWVYAADDVSVAGTGDVIVSLARWRAGGAEVSGRTGKTGISVEPDDVFDPVADRLDDLALVSISFPKFSDGRGYSQARVLRDQLGFTGEVRARGEVLMDQVPLMMRCGFDAFEVCHEPTIAALKSGTLPGIEQAYQLPRGQRFGSARRGRSNGAVGAGGQTENGF